MVSNMPRYRRSQARTNKSNSANIASVSTMTPISSQITAASHPYGHSRGAAARAPAAERTIRSDGGAATSLFAYVIVVGGGARQLPLG
jgi:hypothetical protein